MSYKYPEYILKVLRQRKDLDEDDTTYDDKFQEYKPEHVFCNILEWEGIIGYDTQMLSWIYDIFGVNLRPGAARSEVGDKEFKPKFVFGLGNIFRALPSGYTCGVEKMECDAETEDVTIHYDGGGTHHANIYADSPVAAVYDIIKQRLL